jgi:hypothetical protein
MQIVRAKRLPVSFDLRLVLFSWIQYHAMKTHCGSGSVDPLIRSPRHYLELVVSFTPWPLYPSESAPGSHWTGDWVGLRALLDAVVKSKILNPRRESNPNSPIAQPVSQSYTEWAITALRFCLENEFCVAHVL